MPGQKERTPPDDTDILYAVGLGLCRWSEVEAQLYSIFPYLVGTETPQSDLASKAALDSVVSLKAKIQAVQAAANVTVLSSGLLYVITKLLIQVSKMSKKRNQIAHFKIMHEIDSNQLKLVPYYQVGIQTTDKMLKQLMNPLTVDDILDMSEDFMDLAASLHWLVLIIDGGEYPEARPEVFPLLELDPIRHILPHTGPRHGKRQRPRRPSP